MDWSGLGKPARAPRVAVRSVNVQENGDRIVDKKGSTSFHLIFARATRETTFFLFMSCSSQGLFFFCIWSALADFRSVPPFQSRRVKFPKAAFLPLTKYFCRYLLASFLQPSSFVVFNCFFSSSQGYILPPFRSLLPVQLRRRRRVCYVGGTFLA